MHQKLNILTSIVPRKSFIRRVLEDREELFVSLLAIVLILIFGTGGYMTLEGWNWFDALYMTVITLATIGYGETHPLSDWGRAFTMVLILMGAGVVTVVLGAMWKTILDKQAAWIFDRQARLMEKIAHFEGHTIFCGFSRLGRVAADELRRSGAQVVVIEKDDLRADEARARGFLVVAGDATDEATLLSAGLQKALRLVTLLPKDSDNLYVILNARETNPSIYIVSRTDDEVGEKRLRRAGADRLISTYSLAARKLADGILKPYVTDFFESVRSNTDAGWKIEEIKVPPQSKFKGQSLKELSLRQRSNVGIAAIVSPTGTLSINPSADTVVEESTTLIVIGFKKDIAQLEADLLQ